MATHPPEEEGVIAPNALAITMVVMLATFMQVLDSTIANVALPHMQASLGAATDTITWVLTSYIAASAIATPLTGWLADKFGRRKLFIAAISGFVITSMMCGMAQSLNQMVAFRMMQGASGAFLVPLGQAFLLDAYPRSLHGKAMAWWGVGVMVGPVMGPLLGGWLTARYAIPENKPSRTACAQIAMDRLVAQYGSQYLLNGKLVINETADCAR